MSPGLGCVVVSLLHVAEGASLLNPYRPSAPLDLKVTSVNETAVRVSWGRPEQVNGVLLGYYLYKDELENGQLVVNAFSQANVIPPDRTQTVMTGLTKAQHGVQFPYQGL